MSSPSVKRHTRRREGFSLVELITVIVLIAILAAIALPRVSGSLVRHRLDGAANHLAADVKRAHEHARLRSTAVTLRFNPTTDQYGIDGLYDPDTGSNSYRRTLTDEPFGVDLVSADFGGLAVLNISAQGYVTAGGNVVLAIAGEQRTVQVSTHLGNVTIAP